MSVDYAETATFYLPRQVEQILLPPAVEDVGRIDGAVNFAGQRQVTSPVLAGGPRHARNHGLKVAVVVAYLIDIVAFRSSVSATSRRAGPRRFGMLSQLGAGHRRRWGTGLVPRGQPVEKCHIYDPFYHLRSSLVLRFLVHKLRRCFDEKNTVDYRSLRRRGFPADSFSGKAAV
jgi:hypothetical protein